MSAFTLLPNQTILLIIDMQEKVFATVDRGLKILHTQCQLVKAFQILNLPMIVSEQYPQGLGQTIDPLKNLLGSSYHPWIKSTFSCLDDPDFLSFIKSLPFQQFVVVGIEAHICVLQTVKGLLSLAKQVTVLNDAISSCFIDDYCCAIAEMRDNGARISCSQTILFELLKDSKHPQFKEISHLIKTSCCSV